MPGLNNFVEILDPIKLAVESLRFKNCDNLKYEMITSVLLKKNANIQNVLAIEFLNILNSRIVDRRNQTNIFQL